MQLESMQPLTRRVLAHFEANALDTVEDMMIVPGNVLTDPGRFAADQVMMRRVPHVVAWSGELADPGTFTTKDVAGVPVLLVRDRDGRARAFLNACAHRGSQVASGSGEAARFTCPYHAWTYDAEGRLVGVPNREMFPGVVTEDLGLVPLPCAESVGLIVVGLTPDVDVHHALDSVAGELAGYPFADYAHAETVRFDLQANWKLVVDVNFEGYHFPFLHRATLAAYCSNHSVFDTFDRHCRWAFPFNAIEQLRDVSETEWPDRFVGTVVYGLFPSCVLIESPMSTQMLRVYPGRTAGQCTVYLSEGSFGPIVDEEHRARLLHGLEGACQVLRDEDFPAAESCQRGVEGGREQLVLGRNEPLVQHLHRSWDAALTVSG